MEVQHQKNGDEEILFYIEQDDSHVAEMYAELLNDDVMNIYHTHVAEDLQGQNIGQQLVEAGVNYARQHHLKIEPSCTFAQSVFARVREFDDVLA